MTKRQHKLNPTQKVKKKGLREVYETVFIGGKQKRVKREPTVDGLPMDEFIQRNADPIWLHQNEMWEVMDQEEQVGSRAKPARDY